jgi:ABC-type sugar transport system, periplasmic component
MKKSAKKIITLALAATMVTATFSGFSYKNKSIVKPQAAKTTITFWTISLQPTFTSFFNGIISDYERKHTNINIVWKDLPYDSIQQKLITSIAGGTSPDVVNLNTQMALELAGKNALVNMNKEATAAERSIYVPSLYNSAKVGNAVYAFPWYASPSVMVYNKALFKKAGITKVPTSFDAALTMAKSFKAKTGAYLFMPDEFSQMLFENNIDILNAQKTKAAFNNAKTLALIKKYKAAVDANIIPKANWGKWDEELKSFETSTLGIINSSGSTISRTKDEAPDVYKNLGIAMPMTGSAGFALDPLMNVVVPTASKNHKAAIAFAYHITDDPSQLAFCKKVAIFPSTKVAAADKYFSSDKKTLDGLARYYSALVLPKSKDFSLGIDNQDDITKEINKIYEGVIMSGSDQKSTIASAEAQVNSILAQSHS